MYNYINQVLNHRKAPGFEPPASGFMTELGYMIGVHSEIASFSMTILTWICFGLYFYFYQMLFIVHVIFD